MTTATPTATPTGGFAHLSVAQSIARGIPVFPVEIGTRTKYRIGREGKNLRSRTR